MKNKDPIVEMFRQMGATIIELREAPKPTQKPPVKKPPIKAPGR
jgi:hypothetical protein